MGEPEEKNPPEIVTPAVPAGRLRLDDPGALPVLAEMNGLYYQAFEIAERPYNGKRMEYHPGGIEKKETLFVEGALSRITEWDESGQKRSEVNVSPTGVRREQYWDATGKPLPNSTHRRRLWGALTIGRLVRGALDRGGVSRQIIRHHSQGVWRTG